MTYSLLSHLEDTSPEEEHTVSSASLCMSPNASERIASPLYASTPRDRLTNGHDVRDSRNSDALNGNENPDVIMECTNSMDVLSCGESDAGDTLNRRNNNTLSSCVTGTIRDRKEKKDRGTDVTYFVAKELLMTERTYKRDLELITVAWSTRVSALTSAGTEVVTTLARACLALEPLALASGALLAKLEKTLSPGQTDDNEEPEYKYIAEILYDFLSSTNEAYDTYTSLAGTLVAVVESMRRTNTLVLHSAREFDAAAPLPLSCLLLRPLQRLLHFERLADELATSSDGRSCPATVERARAGAEAARAQLAHVQQHAALCQLQRDITGYDKLLVGDREFLRLGCLYKHSSRGLQQRMLFLFNDICVVASKSGAYFRAHHVMALNAVQIKRAELPHSFTLIGDDTNLLLSANSEQSYLEWFEALSSAIHNVKESNIQVDTLLTPYEQEVEPLGSAANTSGAGGALPHVCWHRFMSLGSAQLTNAYTTHLSGYLLRKFKNSHGWQKLWVVWAAFTLYFYKSCHDVAPLASLPLPGYSVGRPAESDAIHKDFVFKLQYKNHVYFFRADSIFTYNRWTEVLRTAMVNPPNPDRHSKT